jgi:hypothetical protein
MRRVPGIVATLAAVALLSQGLAAAEAPKLKGKSQPPKPSFSELQGITTTVSPVESRSRASRKKKPGQ